MNLKCPAFINNLIRKYHLEGFRDVAMFMGILILFHFLWKIFVVDILSVDFIYRSANWLAGVVYHWSEFIVRITGIPVVPFDEMEVAGRLHYNVFFHAPNTGYVYVNLSCSGLKQFYQWFFLMILYPGPWKHKAWFIPFGLLIIHLVNVMRIIGMILVTIHLSEYWDFMHDYVMRPFFYVVMFLLWVWWNEKFYLKSKQD
ncbi:MAG: hypothetical protein Kow00127_11150 [Bacteroidales bacterium]